MAEIDLTTAKAQRDYLAARLATARPDDNLSKAVSLIDELLADRGRLTKELYHLRQEAKIVHARTMGASV